MVDGVAAWVACAGAPATAARDDIDAEVVIKQPPKIQLILTAHEFVETGGCWRCTSRGRYARTKESQRKLTYLPCIPRPGPRHMVDGIPCSGTERPAAAAGLATAAAAAAMAAPQS
eukprot:6788699-Pyramimonas_sp.AAC.1